MWGAAVWQNKMDFLYYYEVCRHCFEANPYDISLVSASSKCNNEPLHGKFSVDNVKVFIQNGKLVKIRPRPQIHLPGGRFVLCNGAKCRGNACTYAHSPEEMDAWNKELQQG